jgi:hypothetical protein
MLSPHVYPTTGQQKVLNNDCLYIHYPSQRLDLQIPLALRSISADHSPDLIDNMYLTGVHSTDSATTIAFMIHLYIQDSTADDTTNIIAAQLEDKHKQRMQTFLAQL